MKSFIFALIAVAMVIVACFVAYSRKGKASSTATTPTTGTTTSSESATGSGGQQATITSDDKAISSEDMTTPVNNTGPVGQLGPVSPQADPNASRQEAYDKYPDVVTPAGEDLGTFPDLASKVADLQLKCSTTDRCKGFTTEGRILSAVGEENTWVKKPGVDLYTRQYQTN
jgi:hypothetical protein